MLLVAGILYPLGMDEKDTDEQRMGERIEVGGPAMLQDDGTNWSGYIKNVSHRGVFFACDKKVPAIGREVILTCEGRQGVHARIAWIGESGCGLVLIKPAGA